MYFPQMVNLREKICVVLLISIFEFKMSLLYMGVIKAEVMHATIKMGRIPESWVTFCLLKLLKFISFKYMSK